MTNDLNSLQLSEIAHACISSIRGDARLPLFTACMNESSRMARADDSEEVVEVTSTVTLLVTRTTAGQVTAKTVRDVTGRDGNCICSDPIGSAAAGAPAPGARKSDRSRFFAEGTRLLLESRTVSSEAAARNFLGKLVKDHKATAIAAIACMLREVEPPVDPKPYLLATCKRLEEEQGEEAKIAASAEREYVRSKAETERYSSHAKNVTPDERAQHIANIRALKTRLARQCTSAPAAVGCLSPRTSAIRMTPNQQGQSDGRSGNEDLRNA